MGKARPSVQKRNREARNHEKREAKTARRELRDARSEQASVEHDGDPALAGIKPGPQAPVWDTLDLGV